MGFAPDSGTRDEDKEHPHLHGQRVACALAAANRSKLKTALYQDGAGGGWSLGAGHLFAQQHGPLFSSRPQIPPVPAGYRAEVQGVPSLSEGSCKASLSVEKRL